MSVSLVACAVRGMWKKHSICTALIAVNILLQFSPERNLVTISIEIKVNVLRKSMI